ncbi:MAG: hypothetical protein KGQ52_14235 [Alphaproteobacteria bacterium]|nr:hypothetical protein [Alphaproteobacteria bacterium]
MAHLRHLPGYLLALALLLVGAAHLLAAWFGWMDRFGPLVAMLALILSLFGGFNAYGLVGAFFFAFDYLHWPAIESIGFAAVGLLFANRAVIRGLFTMLTARPDQDSG